MFEKKRKKGQASPEILGIVGIAVICFLVAEGYGFIDVIPGFGKPIGNTKVETGWIARDGTIHKVQDEPVVFSYYPGPGGYYSASPPDSSSQLSSIFGRLKVKVKTDNPGEDVKVNYDGKAVWYGNKTLNSTTGGTTVSSGSLTAVDTLKVKSSTLEDELPAGREVKVTFRYNITAKKGGKTDTAKASGTISVKKKKDTLKIVRTKVETGKLELLE